jgi:restriction system protein
MNTSNTPINNEPSTATENNSGSDKHYYLIRSRRSIPFEDGVVGVGWVDAEFCKHADGEAIIQKLKQEWGRDVGRSANQIRRFKAIRKGDIIVVPSWGTIAIGIATGEESYDPKSYDADGANQHRVDFYRDSERKVCLIPRANLSEALQKRLKIRITIANLNEFKSELDVLVASQQEGKTYSWTAEIKRQEEDLQTKTKTKLLNNIRRGRTGLASGGIGLEQLVKELLLIDGFTAEILGKRAFPGEGDADIKASKTDMLTADDFLIQVKHHDGTTGLWGQQQLMEIKKLQPEEYKDCKLALVTSGDVSDENKVNAIENDITILDGNDLVDWIFSSMTKLDTETKRRLGISEVPQIMG